MVKIKKRKSSNKRRKNSNKKLGIRLYLSASAIVFSSVLILGSTYAWFTSTDDVSNQFEGSHLQASLTEVFTPNMTWIPGTDTTKQIRVQNTGQAPALIRVSLYEYFLAFKVDTADKTGNGGIMTVSKEQKPQVDASDTATWQAAAAANGTYEDNGVFYVADVAHIPDRMGGKERFKLNDSTREQTPMQYVSLEFTSAMHEAAPVVGTTNYWLYQDGYFYYSELMEPGAISQALLEKVQLSVSVPNHYKGSLYQLNPFLEVHDATIAISDNWGIGTSGPVYEMIKDYLSE